jgi:hypothetical protein
MQRRLILKCKDETVNIEGLDPILKAALVQIEYVYAKYHTELVITSGKDGKHGEGSLHYEGKAVDLRTWNVLASLVNQLKAHLGPDYDVVLEADHIHIELDKDHNRVVK